MNTTTRLFTVTAALLLLLIVAPALSAGPKYEFNPENGHYYEFINATNYADSSNNACSQRTPYMGLSPYLVTITSPSENYFVMDKYVSQFGTDQMFWMSGYSDDMRTYTYNSGPEAGAPMYDSFFDKCNMFCMWASGEPNLVASERYVHYNHESGRWNNRGGDVKFRSICEYGGLEEPYIQPVRTVGSKNATISNILGWNLLENTDWNITVTFTNKVSSETFKCENVILASNDSVTCSIPPGTGSYTVNVTNDANSDVKNTFFQYQAPYVSTVYTKFLKDELITVTGDNFGNITSLMSISVSDDNITCTNIQMLKNNAVTCVLSQNVVKKFLPITMTVQGLSVTSFKAAFPYKDKLYACWHGNSNFYGSNETYAANQRIDGLSGRLGYVPDDQLSNLLKQICALVLIGGGEGPATWEEPTLWTSLQYSSTLTPPYSTFDPSNRFDMPIPVNRQTNYQVYVFKIADQQYYADSLQSQNGTLTEFIIDPPYFLNNNDTVWVHTEGETAELQVGSSGTVLAQVYFTFRGTKYNVTRDFISNTVFSPIPAGLGGPYQISILVEDVVSTNNQWIMYYPPAIQSISSALGGLIMLNGTDFYSDASLIKVTFGGKSCTDVAIVHDHTSITCLAPPGTGTVLVIVDLNGTSSAPYSFLYKEPSISSISPIGPQGGLITVEGDLLTTDSKDIVFFIGSIGCSSIAITVANTFTCTLAPGGTPGAHTASLRVSGMPDNSNKQYYFNNMTVSAISTVPQNIHANITIDGSNFGESNVSITLADIQCTASIFISASRLICDFPATVIRDTEPLYTAAIVASGFTGSFNRVQFGPYVEIKCADPTCSGHGVCNPDTGMCDCDADWESPLTNCSNAVFVPKTCADPTCSGHGTCSPISGLCVCATGWGTPQTNCRDKSQLPDPIIVDNGTTTNPGGYVNFTTSIVYLREIDSVSQETVKLVDMVNIKFIKLNTSTDTVTYLNGTFANETVSVHITLTTFKEATTIQFAGHPMDMPANSVKYLVGITGWRFTKMVNSLQVIYMSKTAKSSSKGCDNVETTSTTVGNQYEVVAGGSVLIAKFSEYLVVDGRSMSTSLLSLTSEDELVKNIVAKNNTEFVVMSAVVIPHFYSTCEIDPSFSALITNDDPTTDCGKKKNSWRIPVIVVCSVIGAGAIAAGTFIYIKRRMVQKAFQKQIRMAPH
eukprot:gene16740-19900_t